METNEKLFISGSNLYRGKDKIFSSVQSTYGGGKIQVATSVRDIHRYEKEYSPNLVVSENGTNTILVGTGECCHGHVYVIEEPKQGKTVLQDIVSVDVVVMVLMQIVADSRKVNLNNPVSGALVVGYGCSGAGVEIIDTFARKPIDVMNCKEFLGLYRDEVKGIANPIVKPVFEWNSEGGIELHVTSGPLLTDNGYKPMLNLKIDLSDRLRKIGVNLDLTRSMSAESEKVRRW